MRQSELTGFIARYISTWHKPDLGRRRELILELRAKDAEIVTAKFTARGADEILARVDRAHEEWVVSRG